MVLAQSAVRLSSPSHAPGEYTDGACPEEITMLLEKGGDAGHTYCC